MYLGNDDIIILYSSRIKKKKQNDRFKKVNHPRVRIFTDLKSVI